MLTAMLFNLQRYFNWGQGQPNGDGNKTCVAIVEGLNRKWALKRCSDRADFICEKGPIQTSLMQNTYGTASKVFFKVLFNLVYDTGIQNKSTSIKKKKKEKKKPFTNQYL